MQVKRDLLSGRFVLIASIFILALIIVTGLIFIRKKSSTSSNLITAIPADASLIIQINDYHNIQQSLFEKNNIWNKLNIISPFDKIDNTVKILDSLATHVPDFSEVLYKGKIYISGHFVGGRKTDFLYIIEQNSGKGVRQIVTVLEDITKTAIANTERKYEGKEIFTFKLKKDIGNTTYFLAIIEGNILLSKSVILIENSIRQYSLSKSLLDDAGFAAVLNTAGKNKDANVYLNMKKFSGILSGLASSDFSQKVKSYNNFAGWMELDLNVIDKQLMFNGFVQDDEHTNSFADIFKDNDPVIFSADKLLPASVNTFFSIGAKDLQKLFSNYKLYLQELNNEETRSKKINEIDRICGSKIEELFLSFIDGEITAANGIIPDRDSKLASAYVLIKCISGSQAEKNMKSLAEKAGKSVGLTYQQLTLNYSIDNDTKFSIVEFPVHDITGALFGGLFSIEGKSYYTILGNYIIFGNSVEALREFLYSNVLSKTLSTYEGYKSFNGNIAQKSFFLTYTNLGRSADFYSSYLHEDIIRSWEDHYDIFQMVQTVGFQITKVSNMYYANMIVQTLDTYKGKPKTIWESLLDTTFSSKPQLVENHYNKQKEIFIQDDANTIYLINKAGRILWRQKIAEPINSKIYQVDYFKNGKMQLMFSSANYLHLLDRNGNYVERYPVRLRSEATSGMSVFDYDNNREYRIFIPCEDKKVYAYSVDGSLINGWQYEGSDYPVTEPIEHFRIADKDFIVFGDKFSTYILDRRGSSRVITDKVVAKSGNNYFLNEKNNVESSGVVTTDTTGNIVFIDFNGRTTITKIADFSPNHFFDFKDVNADGSKDYIFLDGNTLSVYGQNKSKIYDFTFPNTITLPPIFLSFSASDRKLGIVDAVDKKIYLINNNGELYKGFPLEGSTLFSIGYLETTIGQFNLIVGGSNNFLYNYSVQ
jgi:hypothetical protein